MVAITTVKIVSDMHCQHIHCASKNMAISDTPSGQSPVLRYFSSVLFFATTPRERSNCGTRDSALFLSLGRLGEVERLL